MQKGEAVITVKQQTLASPAVCVHGLTFLVAGSACSHKHVDLNAMESRLVQNPC
jgi:hypothetical protein